MSLLAYQALAAFIIFLAAVIAVAYPLIARHRPRHHGVLECGDAFASGIFLGAALFHMLPDAIHAFQEIWTSIHYPLAELCCAGGFVLLLFLERLSFTSSRVSKKLAVPYLFAVTLIVHSLIEGAALGINTELAAALVIFVAIFVHKGSESFALSMALCRENLLPMRQIIFIVSIFSLMTPIGIALGTTITSFLQFKQGKILAAGFNAFAAGTFLYMSTLHHINHHQRMHDADGMLEFFCLLLGLGLMGVIVFWV